MKWKASCCFSFFYLINAKFYLEQKFADKKIVGLKKMQVIAEQN